MPISEPITVARRWGIVTDSSPGSPHLSNGVGKEMMLTEEGSDDWVTNALVVPYRASNCSVGITEMRECRILKEEKDHTRT